MMIAIIKEGDGTYVSPVFAIKDVGWKSEILAFNQDRTHVQRIKIWRTNILFHCRRVFIVKTEKFAYRKRNWTGYDWVLYDKDFWKKMWIHKAVSTQVFSRFKEYAKDIVLPEWFEIKSQTDSDDLMSLCYGFHDSTLKTLEQNGDNIEIEFDTSWQCNITVKFQGVKDAAFIDHVGIIYDSVLEKTKDGCFWKIRSCDAGSVGGIVDFEILPNDPYIICKNLEWKIEIL